MRHPNFPQQTDPALELPFFEEPSEVSRFLLPHKVARRLRRESLQKAREQFQQEVRQEDDLAQQEAAQAGPATKRVQQGRATFRSKKVAANAVQVFCMSQVDQVWNTTWSRQAQDRRSRAASWFEAARNNSGSRTVPKLRAASLSDQCRKLSVRFPHFSDVISHLKAELVLAMSSKPKDFRVSPILLHGAPGIGKTTFASALADMLKVPSEVISAGSSQGSFDVYGTSAHWDSTEVGKVFRLLANNRSAVAVLILDEIDKIESDGRYPILPALLDLLEIQTAKRFRDEAAGICFDASKIIIIATANELRPVSTALLSRFHPIEIPEPTAAERLHLLKEMLVGIQKATRLKLAVGEDALHRIAQSPGDLREMQRVLRISLGHALANNKHELGATDLCFPSAKTAQGIGFLQ